MFVIIIILLSGFALYALLKPPAETYEQPVMDEPFAELKLSSINLLECTTVQQTNTSISTKEERTP